MIKKIAFVFLFGIINISYSQNGIKFPQMQGKTLDKAELQLPEGALGKHTILCIIYSQKTEKALESWMKPIVNTFLVKNPLDPEPYDVNMYFVVLLSGIKDLASDAIEAKFRKNLDKTFHKNVFIYQGSIKEYKEKLDFGKKDEPYFCVIDKDGMIKSSFTGVYNTEKLEMLEEAVK